MTLPSPLRWRSRTKGAFDYGHYGKHLSAGKVRPPTGSLPGSHRGEDPPSRPDLRRPGPLPPGAGGRTGRHPGRCPAVRRCLGRDRGGGRLCRGGAGRAHRRLHSEIPPEQRQDHEAQGQRPYVHRPDDAGGGAGGCHLCRAHPFHRGCHHGRADGGGPPGGGFHHLQRGHLSHPRLRGLRGPPAGLWGQRRLHQPRRRPAGQHRHCRLRHRPGAGGLGAPVRPSLLLHLRQRGGPPGGQGGGGGKDRPKPPPRPGHRRGVSAGFRHQP